MVLRFLDRTFPWTGPSSKTTEDVGKIELEPRGRGLFSDGVCVCESEREEGCIAHGGVHL
jgi:hypothetical protein